VNCKVGVDRPNPKVRHDVQRDCLHQFAVQAGVRATKEERLGYSLNRPGDVALHDYERGQDHLIDLAVFNPLTDDMMARTMANPLAGHSEVERRKRAKNDTAARLAAEGKAFVPFVVSVYGAWSKLAQSYVYSLAHRVGERIKEDPSVVAQRYFQKASFLLLRENARQIIARTPIAAPTIPRQGHRRGAD